MRLRFTDHADVRVETRTSVPPKARHEIHRRLMAMIRHGVRRGEEMAPDLAVYVGLSDGCTAICYPSALGGWVVATVLGPEMKEVVAG